ncbi:MAG: 4-(cytidine 5'-diphospho)-2-C-methyl-D-erythritol kinase, partial [Erysipelotrichaceae bacterium]|nr:4-(cytidine 5'-diphospho)-2-C-methyl-D-erythritol kinase [Erysipelotrichaceae bacterium]
NRLAIVEGIGEKLTFIDESQFTAHLLLVKPSKGVSTKLCFEAIDHHPYEHPDIASLAEGVRTNDYDKVVAHLGNSMEAPSINIVKEIATIKQEMMDFGFDGALMSGSGSCVFGITRDEAIIDHCLSYFQKKYAFVRKSAILTNEMKYIKKK